MNRTVYFADKAVLFTAETPGGAWYAVSADAGDGLSRDKILNFLESHNSVAVVAADPDAAFAAFAAEFTPVEAAGGVVVNGCGEWLMIHRNGRWDLPKGHWEPGETIEECAVREVGEETGVRGVRIVRPLCETFHAYPMRGRWELKRTRWFEMRFDGACALSPQREEGIERVVWCPPSELDGRLRATFPTIRCVMACVGRKGDSGGYTIR